MGYGVNDGNEFPALVRKALSRRGSKVASVINAGMGNNGNGRWVKFLRTEAISYYPNLVVLQIHANDFQDNIRERLFERSPTGELIELSVPSQGAKRKLQSIVEGVPGLAHSYLIGLARQVSSPGNSPYLHPVSDTPPIDSDRISVEEQIFFRLLEEVLSICKDQGWRVLAVLVNIPDKRLSKMEKFFSGYDVLRVIIPGKRDRPDLYYKVDGHWNASGHRFTADRILEVLEESRIQYY
jgi:lysophospholipase L1-like esterase